MITIVGSARGSASLPNKNSVPLTKNCNYDKTHIMCIIISSNKQFEPSKRYNLATSPGQDTHTAASKAHGKCNQTSITINGIYSNRQRPSSARTATLSSFDRTIINNRRRDHPSAHHRCSSPYTIAARPTQLCTVSYGPCTNKYEGDG